ncbi:unnamed protein product [Staurois parvus]|uniref:Uncharacterized protein n=1 Tax=Staurois parvus TaxID=386267 RepID=A0ABN9FAP1_9NEOB|nr:unnamed protein product [Staurois parvus]
MGVTLGVSPWHTGSLRV